MATSTRLVAFGANSGSFYVFALTSAQLTRVGSFAELTGQAIERVLWLAADRLLVLAARKLILIVDVEPVKPRILARVPRADDAAAVTDICVARPLFLAHAADANAAATLLDESLALFVGDARGRLVAHTMRRRALGSVVRSDLLFDFNAPIVQLDVAPSSDALLVSTTSLSLVFKAAPDPTATPLQTPIGTKPRDGLYGAAFHRDGGVVFAARPGKRLWRADAASGNVEATFNFAPSLQTLPESTLLSAVAHDAVVAAFPARTQPLVFSRVLPIPMYNNNLLFASESDAVFLIDLANGNVVQWSQDLREIIDVQLRVAVVAVNGENRYAVEVYVLHSCPAPATNAVARLVVTPLPDERPPASASVSFIDDTGAVQPALTRPSSALGDSASDSTNAAAAMDAPAADDIDVPAAAAPAVAAAADDLVVKKIRRRKTAATTSRRHAEIETGGVAFVPSGPIQRAVVAPGETARIDRATLDAVLGRTAPVEEPPAPVAVVAAAPAAQPAPAAAAIVEPTTIERPLLDRTASEPVVVHEAQKSFSRMLTGNVQKMASSTKEKIASASRQADDLLKSNALVRKLERQDENTATTSAVAPTPTAGVAPAVDAAVPTPTPRAAVSPTVALQQLLRTAVPPCTRVSEMPFDALSVDRRDECSLPLDLCGFRWRRTSRRLIGTLSGWYRDNVATASSSVGDAPRAAVAELLSACMWTEAFAPDAALTFVRAASATHCLDVDDALRCVNMRALNDCVAFLVGTEREASDGLELVRAGCRTRDLLRTLPTLLAASAPDETRREALEVCVANFPVVQARNVAAWLGVATAEAAAAAASTDANDGATVLYLLYSRLLLETHTAMRYDAPFVTTMLGVLLRDGAPPRTDVLDSVSGRFKPNAHKATWRHERTLLALLAPPRVRGERRLFAIDRRRVLAACREVGFYAGVILLLEDEADAIGDALQTALDAGDEATAKRIAARCDDASVWHTVLQTHPEAALLAIASLRPADAVEVLLGGPEVSEQVTRALLASHERAEQQHDAVRAMLVQMAQQVWRRSDVNVAPQLRTVQSAEQAVVTALAGGAVSASDAAAIKQQLQALFVRTRDSYDVAFDYTSALPRTVEESAHHWGKATDKREQATLCAICGLPLSIDPRTNPLVVGGATNAAAAVVLFANCNHVQHQHCAQLWTAETQTLLSPVACVECCRERSAKFN